MTDQKAYQEYIQRRYNAFCKTVIRCAALDKILKLKRQWERQVSLDYLMNEIFNGMSLKVIAYNTYLISSIRIKNLFYIICIIAPMLRKIKATNICSNEKLLLNAIHFIT